MSGRSRTLGEVFRVAAESPPPHVIFSLRRGQRNTFVARPAPVRGSTPAGRHTRPGVEATIVVLLAALALGGALVRSWWYLLAPLVAWPLFYLGLSEDWWGDGLGDGWPAAAAAVTLVSVALTALVIVAASRLAARQ